jgi:hypothetical protein
MGGTFRIIFEFHYERQPPFLEPIRRDVAMSSSGSAGTFHGLGCVLQAGQNREKLYRMLVTQAVALGAVGRHVCVRQTRRRLVCCLSSVSTR